MRTSRRLRWSLCLLVGCAATPEPPGSRASFADEGELWPPARLAHDVMLEQHLVARWDGPDGPGEERFDAVVQKRGDELVVVGLSPLGQVGFTIRWDGTDVDFANPSERALPFPPRLILLDVQRVFYPWLDGPPPEGDCERRGAGAGERVVETWTAGRLTERRFVRLDEPERGAILVRYDWDGGDEWGDAEREHAPRATLSNGRHGYELAIETRVETSLEEAP